MEPQRFRKKPVEIEAIRWDGPHDDGVIRLTEWAGLELHSDTGVQPADEPWGSPDWPLWVWCAASGTMVTIRVGDWLIREPDGSGVYPCHADNFAATYEPLETP